MKITIDDNNLLVIENENISQNKEYTYNVSGYKFSSYDKGIIVYHKKQFKIINLKDLGDKMGVIMVGEHDDEYDNMELDITSMESALKLFDGFNEDTGEKYYFLYKFGENNMNTLNEKLQKLGSKIQLSKSERGIWLPYDDTESVYNPISFLFGLFLVFGNFNIQNGDLKAVKAQIHLFGKYADNCDIIDETIQVLNENGIFINKIVQSTSDGMIYELTSSDYELLQHFVRFYEPIENGLKISKYDDICSAKKDLIDFIQSNPEIPSEGKSEILDELENGIIKILLK